MILKNAVRATTALAILVAVLLVGACSGGTGNDTPTSDGIASDLFRLERDVQALEDSKAIKRLQRAYGYYVDKGMGDRIGDLFSDRDDASVEIGGGGVYVGKDRISEFYEDAASPLSDGQLYNHMVLQGVVHIDENQTTAKGRWRGWIQTGTHGESAEWAEGPYENEYIKEDGVWKFHKVHWYTIVMSPYDPGWHQSPTAMPGPSEDNPPDLPPTEVYQSYPSAFLPPYHYENPVTGTGPGTITVLADGAPVPSLGDAWSRLRAIEARSEGVSDVNKIENLQRSYGYYLDKMLWDDVTDLFSDDATMEVGPSGVYEGQDSIRAYLYSQSGGLTGPLEGELYNHMQLQPIVTVGSDGLTAAARWRAFMQLGTSGSGSGGQWGEGVYENRYVKQDGVWKISSLHLYPTYIAPYEGGWQYATPELVDDYAMGKGVEPDRPSSEDYAAFPTIFVSSFHYGENVTAIPTRDVPPGENELGDVASLEARIADARAAVGLLTDSDELENLAGIYGFYVDMSMHDDVADLFDEEGVVEILGRGVFEGIDRVREYMHNLGPVGPQENGLFNHMHLQPIVTVAADGMSAKVRSRLFVMFGILGTNGQLGSGIYENEFIKEDGIWKLSFLHGYQTYYTLYEDGWARQASGIFAPYPQLPPDRPQSVPYDPYPAAFVPPFHYANPVTGGSE